MWDWARRLIITLRVTLEGSEEALEERVFKFKKPDEYLSKEAEEVGGSILALETNLTNDEVGLPVQGTSKYSALVRWVKEEDSFKDLVHRSLWEKDPAKKQVLKFRKRLAMLEMWVYLHQYVFPLGN